MSFPSYAKTFQVANAPGAIGETGSLYLIDQGLFARPFYNDVFGHTDKQLSGATQLGYLKMWSNSSFEARTQWRLITPTFKEKFGGDQLELPVGRYADWMELQLSHAGLFEWEGETLRWQWFVGFGEIGNHGGKQVHRNFHKLIGSSLLGLDYSDQPKGSDVSRGIELGLIQDPGKTWGVVHESLLNFGLSKNKFMTDLYLNQNQVFHIQDHLHLGLETRFVRQLGSDVHGEGRLGWRFEAALGMRWHAWRPSLKYVSPYLRDDQVGQIYFDPLAFFISW
jgi:hypothetical protein